MIQNTYRRNKKEKLEDFELICKLKSKGYTFEEIAKYINDRRPYNFQTPAYFKLYRTMISKEVQTYNKSTFVFNQLVDDLDSLMIKALEAFTRSTDDKISITERGIVVEGSNKLLNLERTVTTTPQNGDPRFLELYIKALEKKCKLLGLDKPEQTNPLIELFNKLTVKNNHAPNTRPVTSEDQAKMLDDEFDNYDEILDDELNSLEDGNEE